MAHWDYIKVGNVWPLLSLLTSGIMAEIDRRIFKSLNADDGGTWAPTAQIILGGQGLRVNGPFMATDAWIAISPGKLLQVASGATATFLSGSTFNLGSTTTNTGTFTVSSTGQIRIANAGGLHVLNGGSAIVDSGGLLTVSPGGSVEFEGFGLTLAYLKMKASSILQWEANSVGVVQSGANLNIQGSLNIAGGTQYVGINGTGAGHIIVNATGTGAGSDIKLWNGAKVTASLSSFIEADGAGSRIQAINGANIYIDGTSALSVAGNTILSVGNTGTVTVGGYGITLGGLQYAVDADPGANRLSATHVAKAWGSVRTNGLGSVSIADGINVFSVFFASPETVSVVFAHAMANANYGVDVSPIGMANQAVHAQCVAKYTTYFVVGFYSSLSVSAPNVNAQSTAVGFDFSVNARQ